MRAYLAISQTDLVAFVASKSFDAKQLYAPTQQFVSENSDCDEEELEYLLSLAAGEEALDLRVTESAPGIVLAIEVDQSQVGESYDNSITVTSVVMWNQVQCALLAYHGEDELVWFATQEIEIHCGEWA